MAKLAKVKTTETAASVDDFINGVADEQKREDSMALVKLMQKVSKEKPKMWGAALIGFGNHIYESPTSGRRVEWFKVGFSPRKAAISLYVMGIDGEKRDELLAKLGKYKTEGGCVYVKKLADIDMKVLEEMVKETLKGK